MVAKIALEEHFLCPGFEDYWNPTAADAGCRSAGALARLTDFGEQRLAAMDRAGIERAVLGLAGPGVQAERDTATAIRNARNANDFLAREIQKRPRPLFGLRPSCPCRMPTLPPTSLSAACGSSNSAAP